MAGFIGGGRPKKIEVQPGKFVFPGKYACPPKFQQAFVDGFNEKPNSNPHKSYTSAWHDWNSWHKKGLGIKEHADWLALQEQGKERLKVFFAPPEK